MKKERAFGKKNQKGATLVMVVGVFSVLIIIVTATVSAAAAARRQTYTKYCNSQAYYYANSALNVFVSNTATDASLKDFLTNVSSDEESKEIKIGNNSTVKYFITKEADGKLLVKVEGTFDGRKAYSSVLLNSDGSVPKTPTFKAASVSLNNVAFSGGFFATGDIISQLSGNKLEITNDTKIFGNMYCTGNIEFNSRGAIVEGTNPDEFSIQTPKTFRIANDTVRLNYQSSVRKAYINCDTFDTSTSYVLGNQDKYLDIYCTHASIDNSPKIYGNLYLCKSKNASGLVVSPSFDELLSGTIYGDVYVDGSIDLNANYATIKGNLIVTGSCKLHEVTVEGNIYCSSYISGSNVTVGGQIHSPVGGNTWSESHDRPLLASKTKPPIDDPEIVFKEYQKDSEAYITNSNVNFSQNIYNASQSNLVINKTGTITGGSINQKDITINVKDQAIWLKLDINQLCRCNIVINKDPSYPETPVYFYVPTGKSLGLVSSTVITNTTKQKIQNNAVFQVAKDEDDVVPITKGQPVYWMLGSGSALDGSDSAVEGYIYGPKANVAFHNAGPLKVRLSINGSTILTKYPPVIGAVISNKIEMPNESGILYLLPMVDGMPGVTPPDGDDDESGNWSIDTYIRQ